MLTDLYLKTTEYFAGDPKRIQHFTKVHAYAMMIGKLEQMNKDELKILEAASIVHDVGIKKAEELYGYSDGKLQEQLGPDVAEELLMQCDFKKVEIARISYLVGHHHSYNQIDGLDFRILVEADFLVNLFEEEASKEMILNAYERVFKTETGKKLCRIMFGLLE